MDNGQLTKIIQSCLSNLYSEHRFLFDNISNCKEETLNHHFANYLALKFSEYNCDVEYKSSKQPHGSTDNKKTISQNGKINIRPDIIIHKRGYSKNNVNNNLVVFECKKTEVLPPNDEEKLLCLTKADGSNTQQYQFGVAVTYWRGKSPKKHAVITIFYAGDQLNQFKHFYQ